MIKPACRVSLLALSIFGATHSAVAQLIEHGVDRPGSDYRSFTIEVGGPNACRVACNADDRCVAWGYTPRGYKGEDAQCRLKDDIPHAIRDECCSSGTK